MLLLLLRHFSRVQLCDPIDSSPPGSPVPGILQARTLEWVAICFSNAWKWKVKVKSLSRVRLLATPWTAAHQAPPSLGFSRQEYWSGEPLPSPDCEYRSPHSLASLATVSGHTSIVWLLRYEQKCCEDWGGGSLEGTDLTGRVALLSSLISSCCCLEWTNDVCSSGNHDEPWSELMTES